MLLGVTLELNVGIDFSPLNLNKRHCIAEGCKNIPYDIAVYKVMEATHK